MTIEEAKNIKLTDYLHSLGYAPVKQQGQTFGTNHRFGKKTKHHSK